MFRIFCEVSGGVTGHRYGFLKDGDGNVRFFQDRAEAEAEAARCRENVRENARATFSYAVEAVR